MKKKKCPQCKNMMSISSPTCLSCGRPNKFVTKNYVREKWNNNRYNSSINKLGTNKYFYFGSVIILLLLIIIYFN